jgi:OOP family OmpA-OmpF porin
MKSRHAATLAFAALAAAMALPAAAQPVLDDLYVGAGVGQSDLRNCDLSGCDERNTAWRVFGGYRFNRYFAAELGYHDFGKADYDGGDVKSNAAELDGIAAWPIGATPFSVYGKAGVYRGETKVEGLFSGKKHNTDFTYGAGAQYDWTRNVSVRGEWQRYQNMGVAELGGQHDVDVIGVNVVYRFR